MKVRIVTALIVIAIALIFASVSYTYAQSESRNRSTCASRYAGVYVGKQCIFIQDGKLISVLNLNP